MAAASTPAAASRDPVEKTAEPRGTLSEKDLARMQAAISANAARYSLGALQDALRYLGYADHEIEYRSHATAAHQGSLVSAV